MPFLPSFYPSSYTLQILMQAPPPTPLLLMHVSEKSRFQELQYTPHIDTDNYIQLLYIYVLYIF